MTLRTWMMGAAAAAAMGAGAQAQDTDCGRDCLAGHLQAYLDAVAANAPDQVPLSIGFRQTENARGVPVGDGVWETLTAMGPLDRRFYDPVSGNAAYFGTATDKGEQAIVNLRLKVDAGEIVEAEWNTVHQNDVSIDGAIPTVMYNLEGLVAEPPPAARTVPESQRLSRRDLEAVANSYFDGIAQANADLIIAKPGCMRRENGLLVTGRPLPEDRRDDGFEGRSDCTSGQGSFDVQAVAARRYPVIDEEQQVVLAYAVFLRTPGTPKRRNYFSEYFWIAGSEGISDVYSAMLYADPDVTLPNWGPYWDGSFTIPQELWNAR